jgi:hypothetical protein
MFSGAISCDPSSFQFFLQAENKQIKRNKTEILTIGLHIN